MSYQPTHDESNRELCLTCPLAECNDRSPQCPINKMKAALEKKRAYQREYDRSDKRKAYFREYHSPERRAERKKNRKRQEYAKRREYFKARYAAKKMEAMK